jgi:hypothetical protein
MPSENCANPVLTVHEWVQSISADTKLLTFLGYLRGRWQDEKQYEDFSEYLAAIKREIPQVTGGRKSDFSFTLACCNAKEFRVKVGMREIKFSSVGKFGC